MKKEVIVLLLLGILLVSPLVLAQEQAQTYSGLNRFVDNVKFFFSGEDNKVRLALEIREKEVNSAIENNNQGNEKDMSKNLEGAWKKLQVVQEKVSMETAEQVRENSNQIRERIEQEENLSEDFDVYVLEEEKTGLTAEWVVEVNGKEGQTLTREVVNTVGGENKGNRTVEIEERIGEIDVEISNWVVKTSVGKDGEGDNGLTWEVKTEVANGDNGLKPEVKNYVKGDGTLKNDPLPTPDLNKVNPDLYDPNARAPGDTYNIVSGDGGEGDYAEGTTANGDCGDGVDCGSGDSGTEGSNDVAPAVDSNEGDDESSPEDSGGGSGITGEVISSNEMMGNLEEGFGGPSAEDSDCLYKCVVTEGKEESVCMTECGVEPKPEPANEGESCMQKCIIRGCVDKYDIKCQNKNIFSCENECGMIKEPEAQNEAEQCIRDCINEIDPNIECSHGTFEGEGETGNGACQKCAKSCEYLYAGPCLTDKLWIEIEGACMTQGEHMEAVPVMGDSGEGYECTIDLECFDRSDEVGDNPGSGPGIGQEGYVAPNVVAEAMDGVIKFFKGIFDNGNNEKEIEKNNGED